MVVSEDAKEEDSYSIETEWPLSIPPSEWGVGPW